MNENELLLALISLNRAKETRMVELLRGELDWQLIYRLAVRHGIFPLIYRRLTSLESGFLHPDEKLRLDQAFQANTQNNIRLAWKLVELTGLLSQQGIESLAFKGPVLAQQAYGDYSLRMVTDLDILIRPENFPAIYDLLEKTGYVPSFSLGSLQKIYQVSSDNHFTFRKQGDLVEVHWAIAPKMNLFPIPPEKMWQGITRVMVFDQEVRTLSLENSILFTCIHGAKHGWRQLKWIADLAYLTRSLPEESWISIFNLARQFGFYRQVCLGFYLAERLMDAALPLRVHDTIDAEQKVVDLGTLVIRRLFTPVDPPGLLDDFFFFLNSRERLIDRLYFLYDMIFLPKQIDWLTFPLPKIFYPLYYLFRPLRIGCILIRGAVTSKL